MTRWIVFDVMGVIFEEGDDIINGLVPFLRRRGLTRLDAGGRACRLPPRVPG